jgi:hypothetical protein
MWISPNSHTKLPIRPAIISHGFISPPNSPSINSLSHRPFIADNTLHSAFVWDGCRDYAPLITVPLAIKLWEHICGGVHANRQYMTKTIDDAVHMLYERWEIDKHAYIHSENSYLSHGRTMALVCETTIYFLLFPIVILFQVPLPKKLCDKLSPDGKMTDNIGFALQVILLELALILLYFS